MNQMGEAVQQGTGEAFRAKHFIPVSKGQVGRKHQEALLMAAIYLVFSTAIKSLDRILIHSIGRSP